jgi:hypothetical protein
VIGESNPRYFKRVKSLPVFCSADKKSWMTSDLFQAEMRHLDWELQPKKKLCFL